MENRTIIASPLCPQYARSPDLLPEEDPVRSGRGAFQPCPEGDAVIANSGEGTGFCLVPRSSAELTPRGKTLG